MVPKGSAGIQKFSAVSLRGYKIDFGFDRGLQGLIGFTKSLKSFQSFITA